MGDSDTVAAPGSANRVGRATLWTGSAVALAFYTFTVQRLWFLQDDAYIAFRYVANFLNGNGLVYNIGERIEGFTNFGWTVLLIVLGKFGLDYIFLSQLIGAVCGAGLILASASFAARMFPNQRLLAVLAVLLVGANQSLAYWAPAGLESAAFALVVFVAFHLYLSRNWLLIASLAGAALLRPEGALVAGILIVVEWISLRRFPSFTVRCGLSALLVLLPYVAFKLVYYGSIFPNPFFAKTAFSANQFLQGSIYAGEFLKHYGFLGFGLIIPALFFRALSTEMKQVWLFTIAYLLYIVAVGGDVLYVHRFFLPLIVFHSVLIVETLRIVLGTVTKQLHDRLVVLVGTLLIAATVMIPMDHIETYRWRETRFTQRMQFLARQLKTWDHSDFSAAVSTIGIFGYELIGHRIIDMVGLTDSTIARHPEPPIPGTASTWKEVRHNSEYLLSQQPKYILFSTGLKPSAPAEQALLLYRSFVTAYHAAGWPFQYSEEEEPFLISVYRKTGLIGDVTDRPFDIRYVRFFKSGLERMTLGRFAEAVADLDSASATNPPPENPYLGVTKADCLIGLGDMEGAKQLLDSLIATDPLLWEAHRALAMFAAAACDSTLALEHLAWVGRLAPWQRPPTEARARELWTRCESLRNPG